MRILVVTNMWPTAEYPQFGVFVKEQVDALRKAGVEADVLFVNGRKRKANYLFAPLRLYRALLTTRYDLVHAHYALTGFIALSQPMRPVVVTHHGIEVFSGWQGWLAKFVSKRAAKVIVVGPKLALALREPGAVVVGNGVDSDVFKPMPKGLVRERLAIDEAEKIVLFVGEDRPEKRLDLITQAVARASEHLAEHPVSLRIATGLSRSEVAMEMNAADVLVLASDNEGDPVVVKEALACNLPVVSTDVGTVAAMIRNVPGCMLVAQEIGSIADGLVSALGRSARTPGSEGTPIRTWDSIAKELRSIYEDVVAQRA